VPLGAARPAAAKPRDLEDIGTLCTMRNHSPPVLASVVRNKPHHRFEVRIDDLAGRDRNRMTNLIFVALGFSN
jgi:hypothetical protein